MGELQRLFFDPQIIWETLPTLFREGLKNTLLLAIGALVIGFAFGMVLALMGISRRWWVRLPAVVYIDIFRGLPAILTIALVGLGMPTAGFRPFGRERLFYGILALGLISTAYIAEILRAGIQSVDKGQMEAARSVGMTYMMAMRLIIIPQGLRRVLPPLTNEAIAITKDSSLVFVIGLAAGERELFRVGQNIGQQTGNFSPYVAAGLVYLLITIPLTRLVNVLDKRLREGRRVATAPGAEELPASVEVQP
ncbi:MAG TPA: amino acid ABC transporter permease [Egibacteraceae bacterium]